MDNPTSLPEQWVSAATVRVWWANYRCKRATKSVRIEFAPGINRDVAAPAEEAWTAFAAVLNAMGYDWRRVSTWVCRYVSGTTRWSLHAYGVACDVNAYVPNGFPHGGDLDWDKTDFTYEQWLALTAIRTNNGARVFAWGGQWNAGQDYMHWFLQCSPVDMDTGIDWSTVNAEPIVPDEETEMLTIDDKGPLVVWYQECLMAWEPSALPAWGADGDYGDETAKWVTFFQIDHDLPETGNIESLGTGPALAVYHPSIDIEGTPGKDGKVEVFVNGDQVA